MVINNVEDEDRICMYIYT